MPKRLSDEIFKERISKLNPTIEVLGCYNNAKTPVLCHCIICNRKWMSTPDNLFNKPRCPRCSGHYRRSDNSFKNEIREINPTIEVLGNFKRTSYHISVKCKVCGHIWNPLASSLLKGSGCPNCRNINNSRNQTMGEQEFINRVTRIHPNIVLIGNYKNTHARILCKCSKCGLIWKPLSSSLLQGHGCPKCSGKAKKTHDQFITELHQILPNVEVLGEYKNAKTKILCKCTDCGREWNSKPNNLLNGSGCPDCAEKKRVKKNTKSQDTFVSEIKKINPSINILGSYKNAHSRILCQCGVCHNQWNALPMDLLKGTGCPECSHTSTSFMEQIVLLSLREAIGNELVKSRDRNAIGMELDIYIPSFSLAIEIGAWSWHADRLERDERKRFLCDTNGIRLITIYDSCPLSDPPFDKDCYIIRQDLGSEKNHITLKEIINQLFREMDISFYLDEYTWQSIENRAYIKSRKISTEMFIERLANRNSNVDIIGNYKKSNVGIKTRCKKCGYEWSPTPSHLLDGEGCPLCAGTKLKKQTQFEQELKMKNPSIEVLGNYVNNHTKIKAKCMVCNQVWDARPSNLLSGYGCPNCAKKSSITKRRLTHEQFVERMKIKGNPNVEIISNYVNAKTKLKCKCRNCGFVWDVTPNSLLQGHGCKKCADLSTGKSVRERWAKKTT